MRVFRRLLAPAVARVRTMLTRRLNRGSRLARRLFMLGIEASEARRPARRTATSISSLPDGAAVFTNAKVITCDANGTVASALAIDAGRIVAVGDEETVRRHVKADAKIVDLRGATLLPGLIDTHPHLMHFGALAEPLVDLADARSHEDIVRLIAARARLVPKGKWIMTTPVGEPHYFIRRSYRDLAEGELPGRRLLDRAAPHHPVFIQAWAPVTPNVCAMNTLALRRLGISRATPERIGNVWIEKDAGGEPTGLLRGSVTIYYCDSPFMNDLLRKLPLLQLDGVVPGTERAMSAYNAMGVTTVYEGHAMDLPHIDVYRWLHKHGRLTVRVLCAPEAEPYGLPWTDEPLKLHDYLKRLELARDMVDRSNDFFRIDGVTIGRGGPCWPGFTLMREPYLGPYGEKTTGRSFVSLEKIQAAIRFCRDHDVRLNIATAGLAENDDYLDRLEALAPALAEADGRAWLLQHLFFADREQVRRVAALGLDVTTSMSFSWGKGELVGEQFLPDFIPIARLLEHSLHHRLRNRLGPQEHLRADRSGGAAPLRRKRPRCSHGGGQPPACARDVDTRGRACHALGRDRLARARPPCRPRSGRPRSTHLPDRGSSQHSGHLHDARRPARLR